MESKSSLFKLISALAIILLQVNAGAAALGSDFDAPDSTTRKVKASRINGRISKCHDDPTSTFFLKAHKSDPTKGIFQTCAWLKHRNAKKDICGNVASWTDGTGPAKEVCPYTCGVPCNTDAPSPPSPSPSKVPSSSPTMAPTTCTEDSEAKFFLKTVSHNPIQPVYQTCAWLKGRSAKDQICSSVEKWESESGAPGPAREVCLNTCNTCPTEIVLPGDYPNVGGDGDSDGSNQRGGGPSSILSTSDGTNLPTMTASFVAVMAIVAMCI